MNQQKVGAFLKELRKEKGMTQEQFAEIVNVSTRTISRWENGNNMPDLDILIEISDYYHVDLRELLNGERKSEEMDKEVKETVLDAVEYTNLEAERYTRYIHRLFLAGTILWFISQVITHTGLAQTYMKYAGYFCEGAAGGMILCGLFMTSRYGKKLRAFKQRLLKRQ